MKLKKRVKSVHCFVLTVVGAGYLFISTPVFASPVGLKGYVMQIQMTPAICAINSSIRKQRKCLEGYSLNITGLIPEISPRDCRTSSSAKLSPLQAKVVASVMPDESARNALWASVGGCSPLTASQYFRDIISKAEQLKIPADLSGMGNKEMSLTSLKSQIYKLNPRLPKEAIRFNCEIFRGDAVLTGIQICYNARGQYKKCSSQILNTCPTAITIKGAY